MERPRIIVEFAFAFKYIKGGVNNSSTYWRRGQTRVFDVGPLCIAVKGGQSSMDRSWSVRQCVCK